MLNIVIPMAGRGSRFATAGYKLPKPLIDVGGTPMIEVVVNNLRPSCDHRFIFLCLSEHIQQLAVRPLLEEIAPGCGVVEIAEVTEGAACTTLLAEEHIDNEQPLLIANSDQWVDMAMDRFVDELMAPGVDGLIMTMKADDPKWSFVRYDSEQRICEVVEKQVVSDDATVGIYGFRRGADYVRSAKAMIQKDLRVNGEFYVAPTYNEMIAEGACLATFDVGSEDHGMHGLGIPSDLDKFLASNACEKALAKVMPRRAA